MTSGEEVRVTKDSIQRGVLWYQTAAATLVILIIWADEVFDLPHYLLGAPATPINWRECLLESICLLFLLALSLYFSRRFLARVQYLEGLLPICSYCKKVRSGEEWIPIEAYIARHSGADFTHGLCPACRDQHYGPFLKERKP